jgi:superfamily I DNA/RNA helicase
MAAQETRNLRYVALTRSTSELHFVYSRDNRDR